MSAHHLALHEPHETGHHVRFYEAESFIYEAVAEFFAAGVRAGHPIILICTANHRDGIFRRPSLLGFDCVKISNSGQLKWLDARETLAKFMVGDMPDEQLFRNCVGGIIE